MESQSHSFLQMFSQTIEFPFPEMGMSRYIAMFIGFSMRPGSQAFFVEADLFGKICASHGGAHMNVICNIYRTLFILS